MRENKILRIVSYILLPVLVGILIISLVYTFAKDSYDEYMDKSYFDTESFASDHMTYLANRARTLIYSNYANEIDGENRIIYDYSYNRRELKDSYFIIKYGNKIITNVKYYYTVEQISNYIASQEGEKIRIEKGEVKEGHLARKY
ncbi:MAG: hypothetical protein HFJ54_00620 [Clostridia bacterium]|nr:hypothetical protein [Clostridia bacterium]